jgi:signal transduction histidine kinase
MSHELRAPLHVVLGYQSLLLEGDFGALNAQQSDALQRIGKGARQLLELVENTLNMNRIQAGRLPLELRDVEAAELVREVEAETMEQCEASGLGFCWELADDLPAVRTDPTKLKIALKNLIGNAIKYTDEGGVTVTARRRGGGAEIVVADTGCGIEPTALRAIFEPFRQIKDGSAPDRGGVGLGLYIVQRMLDMMGATIAVESKLGAGSTFRVWVPGVKG